MGQALRPTALVVEDDETQRMLVSILLEESEMHVIQCESAEAALRILDRIGSRLAMIFTDVELAGRWTASSWLSLPASDTRNYAWW